MNISLLNDIFNRLEQAGMQVNLDRSKLCSKTVKFLGFELTPTGHQPTRKQIKAILKIATPCNIKKVRGFIGAINFIKNHIPNRAEILRPITELTKKGILFIWGEEQESAFIKIKAAIANAILCTYPDPNKRFIIYPDTSQKYAMGAMLAQEIDGHELIICTFSRKFNDAQLKYTVGKQELLAAHKACRFFHDIIYGCEILIHCNHKNITRIETKHTNLRVLCQRIMLDQEYGVTFEHLAGELNTGADGLSRLEMLDYCPNNIVQEIYAINELNRNENPNFPLAMSLIKSEQDRDDKIQSYITRPNYKGRIGTKTFRNVIVHTLDNKILIPSNLQKCVIDWYHSNLRHPGVTRTINTISQSFTWRGLRPQVEAFVKSCDQCQRHKITGKPNYGLLPVVPALRNKDPFEKVHIDCAGPWTIRIQDDAIQGESKYDIHILTMLDACTNWVELAL